MRVESRWFIKTALLFLLLTAGAGLAFVLVQMNGGSYSHVYVVSHAHAGLIGFVLNMIAGVAYWMFPRIKDQYPETKGRYNLKVVWLCYGCINGGLLLRLVSEPFAWRGGSPTMMVLYLVSVIAMTLGVGLFVWTIWPRIREIKCG
jgi:hypothetical protein